MHGSRHLLRSYVARVRVLDVYLRSEESDEEGRDEDGIPGGEVLGW